MIPHTLQHHEWMIVFDQRGSVFDLAGPYVVGRDGVNVTVDTTHADYPPRPEPPPKGERRASVRVAQPGVVSDDVADARRKTCAACEYGNDLTDHTAHCRKLGNRASCSSHRVVFKTSPATRCPLGIWPA